MIIAQKCSVGVLAAVLLVLPMLSAHAEELPVFDRASWKNWQGQWDGDFWTPGSFGDTQYMTCVGVDGSIGSPEYWAAGYGDHAARDAYTQTLDWVNVADRNPAYIEVHCGY